MFYRPILCHNLFFALRPPTALGLQIAQSAHWFGAAGKFVRAEHLHITLDISHDYPSFPEQLAETMLRAGGRIAAAAVPVVLDEANARSGQVALRPQKPIAEFKALHETMGMARTAAGWPQRRGYRFRPYMTLGYDSPRDFRMAIRPIRWLAEEFVLIHSLVGRTEHRELGRWRLSGGGARQSSLFDGVTA